MENINSPVNYTWDEQADCLNCIIHGKLVCKWDNKILSGLISLLGLNGSFKFIVPVAFFSKSISTPLCLHPVMPSPLGGIGVI